MLMVIFLHSHIQTPPRSAGPEVCRDHLFRKQYNNPSFLSSSLLRLSLIPNHSLLFHSLFASNSLLFYFLPFFCKQAAPLTPLHSCPRGPRCPYLHVALDDKDEDRVDSIRKSKRKRSEDPEEPPSTSEKQEKPDDSPPAKKHADKDRLDYELELQAENRALREENKSIHEENRILREENAAFREENALLRSLHNNNL